MQTVPIMVSNALQRIYYEIDNQIIFLNCKAEHGRFSLLCRNNIDETCRLHWYNASI